MSQKELQALRNVGPAFLRDLAILGIESREQLKNVDPTTLFHRLERLTQKQQDFCVWDVFAAIIHEASTGEATDWWAWTKQRKDLQEREKLKHVIK